VNQAFPGVTVVIPTRPGQADIPAVTACRGLDYPPDRMEILVARGNQPAVQRNAALHRARGELVYFLDDDSVPQPGNLRRAADHFRRGEVAMVGGPNLCPDDAPGREKTFAVVLASFLAFGPSRARYDAVGGVRETSEKELILCNLMARREALLAAGGFDESLYPNEENALMDALARRGAKLLYDPDFVVRRRPRPTLRSFCRMLLNYGRGRAEQFRLHPTAGSILNFVPPLFCVYLAALPWLGRWGVAGLGVYGLALVGQTVVSGLRKGWGRSLGAAPLVALTHVLYGIGFWRGLFTVVKRGQPSVATKVNLETVKI
jgi:glycosyltransferase involved in cell wall biosynthesis